MKKYIYILLSASILLSFTACNDDFLNLNPKDQLSEKTFWSTETDAFSALVGVYSRYTDYDNVNIYYDQLLGLSARTDEAVNVWKGSNYNNLGAGTISPFDDYIFAQWAIRYRIIRTCNVFLKNIDRPVMKEDERTRMKAEVMFLRAFAYHYLLNNHGGVPIVKEPLTLQELKRPRNTAEEVQNFILEDLSDEVIDVLPLTYSNEYKGRITRGAAYALKARVYLYAGKWKEAAAAAKKVMDFKTYSLYPNYEDLFESANKYNDEILYAWQYVGLKMANYTQIYLHFPTYGGWGGINPIQSFVDEFLCTDGKPSSTSTVYNPSKPYEKRDPRFNMSIIYPGATYRSKVIPIYGTIDYPGETGNSSQTGYYVRKFLDNISESNNLKTEDSNVILIRYAEVLLTYAEAKVEQGQIDQSVYDAINALRARAYGVDISETSKYPAVLGGTQSELRDIVRRERMVELCFEGQRRDDIIRWRIADKVMNDKCYGIPATVGGENIFVMERKFDPTKDYLLPIPQREIDLVGKDILIQNPGWE
jgi:starch-binding outer membrane protein, SusD/RagB family